MRHVLIHQGQHKALDDVEKKHDLMTQPEWEEMNVKSLSTTCLYLSNEVLHEVYQEKTTHG